MIAKHTSDAISSSAASTVSSSFVASRPATRKPPELTSRCYASQQQGSRSKLSTRPNIVPRDWIAFDGPAYCAGCNGSFILDFRHTSVGTSKGVYGVGFDFVNDGPPFGPQYTAFITFGDKSSVNELLP